MREGNSIGTSTGGTNLQTLLDVKNGDIPNLNWFTAFASLITDLLKNESDYHGQIVNGILRSIYVDTAIGELRTAIREPLSAAMGQIIGSLKKEMHDKMQAEIGTMQRKKELAMKARDNPSILTQAETAELQQAKTEFRCKDASDLLLVLNFRIGKRGNDLQSLENLFEQYVCKGSISKQSE